jgi:hypothetical protein
MKKQILAISIVLISGIAYAQPQKGRSLLGASLNGNYSNDGSSVYQYANPNNPTKGKYASFGISPNLKYFVSDKSAIGFGLSYNTSSQKQIDTKADTLLTDSRSNAFGVNINHTKYFLLKGKLYLGLQNQLYSDLTKKSSPKQDYYNRDMVSKSLYMGYSLSPGLVYFASDRLVLSTYFSLFSIGFRSSKSTYKYREYDNVSGNYVFNDKHSKNSSIEARMINWVNLSSLSVGIHYYLGKKASE